MSQLYTGVNTCDHTVRAVYGSPSFQWEAPRCAKRTRIENELHHFLQAPEIVFVMLGMSGTGKSWVIADWTGRVLQGRARLLIPGSDLDHVDQRVLSRLIAQRLRVFISAPISDEDLLARLRAFARLEGKGPFVLVIDDLQPTGDISVFRRDLGKMVEQCRVAGIKLILTAQTHVWELYRLGQEILQVTFTNWIRKFLKEEKRAIPAYNYRVLIALFCRILLLKSRRRHFFSD